MQVTEKLARHIIWLQGVAEGEIGDTEEMTEVRDQLEAAFPVLKKERDESEFNHWLLSERVEAEPTVKRARYLLGHDIPFDEVYADNPELPESTYQLYREHTEVASYRFQSIKSATDKRLMALDARGEIDLKAEWEACRRIKEVPNHGRGRD